MKMICVSMDLDEKVLDSYLLRVFAGELVNKKTCKTIRFSEENLSEKGWNKTMFKNFCEGTISNKLSLRMYKAKLTKKKEKKK